MLERGIQWARDRAARAGSAAPAAARPLTQASVTSYFQPGRENGEDRQQQQQSTPAGAAAAAELASLPRALTYGQ